MKNKLITRFLIMVAGIVSVMFMTSNAFALAFNNDNIVNNKESVVSPFWQSDGSVYTFVAVSHSSLTGMNSTIGVTMTALQTNGSTFGTTTFTVTQNTTTRVFIVATNHSTINTNTVTGSNDLFISGTTNLASGHLQMRPRATNPNEEARRGGGSLHRMRDITTLAFWGSVVVPGTNTGFAMEFIGDTHDSLFGITTLSNTNNTIAVGVK